MKKKLATCKEEGLRFGVHNCDEFLPGMDYIEKWGYNDRKFKAKQNKKNNDRIMVDRIIF